MLANSLLDHRILMLYENFVEQVRRSYKSFIELSIIKTKPAHQRVFSCTKTISSCQLLFFSVLTNFIAGNEATASRLNLSVTCAYFATCLILLCPSSFATVYMSTPFSSANVANVRRAVCQPKGLVIPALLPYIFKW